MFASLRFGLWGVASLRWVSLRCGLSEVWPLVLWHLFLKFSHKNSFDHHKTARKYSFGLQPQDKSTCKYTSGLSLSFRVYISASFNHSGFGGHSNVDDGQNNYQLCYAIFHPERESSLGKHDGQFVLQVNFKKLYDSYFLPLIEFQYKTLSSHYIFKINLRS